MFLQAGNCSINRGKIESEALQLHEPDRSMPWEKFAPSGGRAGATRPIISMRRSNGIGINQPALDEFFADADGVQMVYDKEENKLGMIPIESREAFNEEHENDYAYTLTRASEDSEGTGGSVTPQAFFSRWDLDFERTTRFEPFEDEGPDGETIVAIDLDEEPVSVAPLPEGADEDEEE